jgi:uncharacterized protein (TIGR03437 family)
VNGRAEVVPAAGFGPGAVAPDSIASLFSRDLSLAQTSADSRPLPTSLYGAQVTILDSAGTSRLAPLFMVSPSQINFVAPSGLETGPGTLTISGAASQTVQIAVLAGE